MIRESPLLSIVIANYNYGAFIEDAITSILRQCEREPLLNVLGRNCLRIKGLRKCETVELIVCDGASTDNSVDIIKSYSSFIAWWCSETDNGQSAAFNKGFAHASGRFLTWLNADDILIAGTLRALSHMLDKHPDTQWITGNLLKFEHHNGCILEAPWGPHIMPACIQRNGFPPIVFGPTTFFSREVYQVIGPIDESLHYVMDTDYWMRMLNGGYRYRRLNRVCWGFRLHEVAKTATFTNHSPSVNVRRRIDAERDYIYGKNRFKVTIVGQIIVFIWRILDGSRFVDAFRRLFLIGREFYWK